MLRFKGCAHFRHRLVCSVLSGRPVHIDDIRALDERPGLQDFEASFLRLLEKLTNGTVVQINETGTQIRFRPGVLVGGKGVTHDCGTSRSVGYFVEALIALAPFAKEPITLTLRGITNDNQDPSVDHIRTVILPLLKHFGIESNLELRIVKRGAPPSGGGEVVFKCPLVRNVKPINLVEEGKVRRIRGVAYSTRVSPQIATRLIDAVRQQLNPLTEDLFIYTDHYRGGESGQSPGFGVSLVAETTTGQLLGAEYMAAAGGLPEEVGRVAGRLLCDEITKGGCVDTTAQTLVLLFMVLCPEDVSRVRLSKLSQYCVQFLRQLRDFFGITFKITPDPETRTIVLSCLGTGFLNLARRTT